MTEVDWLKRASPRLMLRFLRGNVSDRKLRFFAVACCRRIWDLLEDDGGKEGVAIAERQADGLVEYEEWIETQSRAAEGRCNAAMARGSKSVRSYAARAAFFTLCRGDEMEAEDGTIAEAVSKAAANAVAATAGDYGYYGRRSTSSEKRTAKKVELIAQRRLLRDIVGDPFRPAVLNTAWLNSTVTDLARNIYDKRAFDRMPILADALEEAGCDNADILKHCREPGTHARGCWVIDLLLGME